MNTHQNIEAFNRTIAGGNTSRHGHSMSMQMKTQKPYGTPRENQSGLNTSRQIFSQQKDRQQFQQNNFKNITTYANRKKSHASLT